MQNASHSIRQEIHGVLLFLAAIWGVFVISLVWPSIREFGLVPRTAGGLWGIATMPLLHGDWQHIASNTPALLVLLALLAGSQARSAAVVVAIVVLSGVLLWIFGRPAIHIGASGLVFGLIAFLIVSGFLEGRIVPLLVAILVGFLFGGTLLSGVVPHGDPRVSWDGHLCGAVAGGLAAYALTRKQTTGANRFDIERTAS